MLELTCRLGQSLVLGDPACADAAIHHLWTDANLVEVTVVEVREEGEYGDHAQVRLGIKVPPDVAVHRKEVYLQIQQENEAASRTPASTEGQMLGFLGESTSEDLSKSTHNTSVTRQKVP